MPSRAEDFTSAVVKALPAFFTDALDQLLVGEGAYIATGEPQGIVAQTGQAVARAYCRRYAATDPALPGNRNQRTEQACRAYLDSLSPGKGESFVSPFQGGQCPGEIYRFTLITRYTTGTIESVAGYRAYGPFNLRARVTSSDSEGNPTNFDIEIFTSAFAPPGAALPAEGVADWRFITSRTAGGGDTWSVRAEAVEKLTGGALECGNPPPAIEPQIRIPDGVGNPFRFNPGPRLDVPISVEINPDGSVTIDVGTGPVSVDLFPGDDNGGGEPGGGGGSGSGEPGEPAEAVESGEGGDSEGEAPEGQEIVGLKIEVVSAPPAAPRVGRTTKTVYRGAGYVRMGYEDRLGVDVSGGTVFPVQFYHASQRGLTHWMVSANIGFNLRTTPYYRALEE